MSDKLVKKSPKERQTSEKRHKLVNKSDKKDTILWKKIKKILKRSDKKSQTSEKRYKM